jgi:hypothetical protein
VCDFFFLFHSTNVSPIFCPFLSFGFCFEHGYLLSSLASGDYGRKENYSLRPHDEIWTEGMEPLPAPDWQRFHDIWKLHVPKLRIRNACEDTCPECFVLKNKFWYLGIGNTDDKSINSNEELPEDFAADEALLFNANLHAEQAQQQRNLAAERQHVAVEEAGNAHGERRFVVVFFFFLFSICVRLMYVAVFFFKLLYGL